MAENTPSGAQSRRGPGPGRSTSSDSDGDHVVLNEHRPFRSTIPDSSVGAVRAVARLDGRTRIIGGRVPGGPWLQLRHRQHFTRAIVVELRAAGVSEVILKRGLKRASFPLGWLSNRKG